MKVKMRHRRGQSNSIPLLSGEFLVGMAGKDWCVVQPAPHPSPPLPTQIGVPCMLAGNPGMDSMDFLRIPDAEGGGVHQPLGG